ncbi:MAG: N-acetylglucosamine-6-phosphate deacetylase [Sphingobacteriaceae bacterium]
MAGIFFALLLLMPMITALHNATLITDGKKITGSAVLIDQNTILKVVPENEIPEIAKKIDLCGAYLSPGLIDLQIYGTGRYLFGGKPEVAALEEMENVLLKQGCTGFLATVATNDTSVFDQAIDAAKAYRSQSNGAFLGLHFEGPFINSKRKGAHPEKYIRKAIRTHLKTWIDRADGEIKMITVAPELQDEDVLAYLKDQNIIISGGHSDASYDQAIIFLNDPIQATTHLFNAMPQMHHRKPGLIAAIFEKRPFTSIVADGIHVDFAMVRLAKKVLGNKLFLITDAVTATDEGIYAHQLQYDRYTLPDGTLSGSTLTMLQAVKNCVQQVGIELSEAINMASLYPAQLLKSDHKKGKIEKGFDADLIILDKNLDFNGLVFKGKIEIQE